MTPSASTRHATARDRLIAEDERQGAAWCEAHAALVDLWITELFASAGAPPGVAVVAIGGYGRRELAPKSDIDVCLVLDRRADVAAIADAIWYPLWDAGYKLGHSVSTAKDLLRLARTDLDTATTILSTRLVAGDGAVADRVTAAGVEQWRSAAARNCTSLRERQAARHDRFGDVAHRVEPDVKEGRGGLRDVHTLQWAVRAGGSLAADAEAALVPAYETLLAVRVALHRVTGRASNQLVMEEQGRVAAALGYGDATELMSAVANAARTLAWWTEEAWREIDRPGRVRSRAAGTASTLAPGIGRVAGTIVLTADAEPQADPFLPLRLAETAAVTETSIARDALSSVAVSTAAPSDPWPVEGREALVGLLLAGERAIPAIEALDRFRLWERLLPEWTAVRSRAQRDPYHTYTVDRHLLETAAAASRLAGRVTRPDLLVVGALLHDIGKHGTGEHVEAGAIIAERVATRIGFPPADVATIRFLVEEHLLLTSVALRRDLSERTTIESVAEVVESPARLALLAALTEADAAATGPSASSPWRIGLIDELVTRVGEALAGEANRSDGNEPFPTPELLARMRSGEDVVEAAGDTVTVVAGDRPGLFSRVAGVVALHGLPVHAARAYSDEHGMALAQFQVPRREVRWEPVVRDLRAAVGGQFAVAARLAEAIDGARHGRRARSQDGLGPTTVTFDTASAETDTIVDVRTADRPGLLFRITRALAEMDLDIRSARVHTLGLHVVDAFYVRDRQGRKVTDPSALREIERAVLYSVAD